MSKSFLSRALRIEPDEVLPAVVSALYFFTVLCAYYLIRPLRDERGLNAGADQLWWIMWVTLAATLLAAPAFGRLVRGRSRRVFIPVTYRFFALTFLGYAVADALVSGEVARWLGVAFYVWVSVFNLFASSLVWAFMADGFSYEQSKRVFGLVAIGGTVGAISGSAIAGAFSDAGALAMIAGSVLTLEVTSQLVRFLAPRFEVMRARRASAAAESGGGANGSPPVEERASAWRGLIVTFRSPYLLGIAGYIFCYALTSTLLYLQQAYVVEAAFASSGERRAYFASVDLWVNILTLAGQLFLTGRVISTFGVGPTLAFLPGITLVGFFVVGADPSLIPFVIVYVLRRAGNFAISRPARETLFTVAPRESRYQAKTFIDTFVYRAGDALASAVDVLLRRVRLEPGNLAMAGAPIAAAWLTLSLWLGHRQARMARQNESARSGAGGS